MSIHFTDSDWKRIRDTHKAWWKGELDRPLVHCTVADQFDPGRPKPAAPLLTQQTCNDFSWSAEELIDALDWEMSRTEYLGDSFPRLNLNSFGPGVTAAFCGAKLDNSAGSVWFFPEKELPPEEISIKYNPDSVWVRRIKDIYRAGGRKWQGSVLMGMPDLGGVMDIVASFVGSENLLYALIDQPEEVHRLRKEALRAFHDAYNYFAAVLQEAGNPGFTDWDGLYSDKPSYVIQSDFSYMIGPDMFREFILDDLEASCSELTNVIYHMDGIGQINHLPYLLAIENLKAIQWVPGDGKPSGMAWLDIYKKIFESDRRCQLVGSREDFLELLDLFPRGFYFSTGFSDREEALRFLMTANCPV